MPIVEDKPESFWKAMGPGIITGAADDDPSGIGTYTQAGAQFGPVFLWTALITWPLMLTVQLASARVGMVTGEGLGAALNKKFPRPIVILFSATLLIANTLNVGADLMAMADCAAMMIGGPTAVYVVVFGVALAWATVKLRYRDLANTLKWLTLCLFAYIGATFAIGPDWSQALKSTILPAMPKGSEQWSMLVAILGTTISPYLFYWQASQEVEEQKAQGKTSIKTRIGATDSEISNRRWDVGLGTFFSNLIMYFIILASAASFHKHGITEVTSSRQAAEALRPIAGEFSSLLYALGLIGVGLLAIPTLTGSAAYAFAETFKMKQGLDAKMNKAKGFYTVIVLSSLAGIFLNLIKMNPLKALYWSAVANGLLAPFVLVGLVLVIADRKIMHGQPAPKTIVALVALTTVLMFAAGVAMFI